MPNRFNPMLSKNKIKYIRSLSQKKQRTLDDVFVAEGRKLVSDLLPHFPATYLAATAEWFDQNRHLSSFFPSDTDTITDDELQRISAQETPQSVLAVFRQQHDATPLTEVASRELCLMLDDVQNPGNLGTIVRIADWFGIRHIFCSLATADIYGPKTVQATMGSLARVHVHYINIEKALQSLRAENPAIPVYGTFLSAPSIYDSSLTPHGILVMGNEGNGISPSVARYVSHRLFIPPFPADAPTAESLNVAVATAIVCAEIRRPR